MKRISLVVLVLLLLLSGCNGGNEKKNNEEKFFLTRLIIYDDNQNMVGMYNADSIGSEESSLTLNDDGKIEYAFYYHGEPNKSFKGSMKDPEKKEGSIGYTVLFEGDGNSNYLTRTESDGKVSIVLVYKYDNEHFAGASFEKEKKAKSKESYKDIEFTDKEPFEESSIYKKIEENISNVSIEISMKYDRNSKTLLIQYQAPDGLYSAIKNHPDQVRDSFESICSSLADTASKYYSAIKLSGYKEVTCRIECLSDNDKLLLRCDNGEIRYKESYGKSSESGGSGGDSSKNGFASSKSYSQIRKTCMDSFSANNPKLVYSESNNTLTLTLTAPKGTYDAVSAKDMKSLVSWYDWTASLSNVSYAGYDMMCKDGYEKIAFIIMICSDKDSSKCLFATMNGSDYYNFAGN